MPSASSYPRVLSVVASTQHPCDIYRTILPFRHLQEAGYDVRFVEKARAASIDWDWPDVVVLNRSGAVGDAALAMLERLKARHDVAFVWEADDDLLHVPDVAGHGGIWALAETQAAFRRAAASADLITVSTEALARVYGAVNPNVVVLPNCVDPDHWRPLPGRERFTPNLTVGVQGSQSHHEDWRVLGALFPLLARQYPHVTLVAAGYCPDYLDRPELRGRLFHMPWVSYEHHWRVVSQIDIHLAPLRADLTFNHGKSPIKAFEAWMAGKAVVASPTVYADHVARAAGGYLADALDEWVEAVGALIAHPTRRKEQARRGRSYVLNHYNLHDGRRLRERMDAYARARAIFEGRRGKAHDQPES